jgi:hypothetical protein
MDGAIAEVNFHVALKFLFYEIMDAIYDYRML